MPGQTIGIRLGFGYPGTFARNGDMYVMNRPAKAAIKFGAVVVVNADGTFQAFGATNTAAQFAGIACREVKQSKVYPESASQYEAKDPCDVLMRGNISVICKEGTPDPLKKVYVATSTGTNVAIGDLCATATPAGAATTVELTACRWVMTEVDADKVTELAIISRNNG
jgi:hypothetical protein